MNAFRDDLRELVAKHIALAPAPQILNLVERLSGNGVASRSTLADRLSPVKLLANGSEWLDPQDGVHVAVYDPGTNLTWAAEPLACGEVPWAQAIEEAKKVRLFGHDDWRLPTVKELISIIDYERFDPAVDPDMFRGPYGWTWTSTVAKSPSVCAWGVSLGDGGVSRLHQTLHGRVRAVRAGQALELGL